MISYQGVPVEEIARLADTAESPLPGDRHGEFGERPKRTRSNPGTAPQADSTAEAQSR